jgi:hypothetical protein
MMKKTLKLKALVVGLAIGVSGGCLAAAQSKSESQLVNELLGDSKTERYRAFSELERQGVSRLQESSRNALISLLERQNSIIRTSRANGTSVSTIEDPEFISQVAVAVAKMKDSRTIRLLVRTTYGGHPVTLQLARFGERAIPELNSVITDQATHYYEVEFGLRALSLMLQGNSEVKLSAVGKRRIAEIARSRLTGKQYFTVLWAAISVAEELDDPEIAELVRGLATDATESRSRGITRDDIVRLTQDKASKALRRISARQKIGR